MPSRGNILGDMSERETRTVQVWCRVTPAEKTELERLAAVEERRTSDIVYRAVRAWLRGGAEQYAASVAARGPEPDYRVTLLAREIMSMPAPARAKFAEFTDMFFANWSARQNADGTMSTRLGTVANIVREGQDSGGNTPPETKASRRHRQR